MRILITGATGFVGSAVLRRLLAAGHEVRALVRPQSDRRNIEGLDAEIVTGDLLEPDSLGRALAGCEALFHVAADYRLWSSKPKQMYSTNVDGTRAIMEAALANGVERIVYTSSVATLGLNADSTPANEETPSELGDMIGHYKRSKFLAEATVKQLVREYSLPAVIVNPSTPIGPRDIKPTPTGRMIADAAAGRIPAFVDTGLNVVHVEDVADGHLLALERGRVGRRYILGAENLSLKSILAEVANAVHRKPPTWQLNSNIVLPLAYLLQAWARLSGKDPRVTVEGVRLAKKKMYFTSDRAVGELGYRPRPARDAIRDAVAWFRDNPHLT